MKYAIAVLLVVGVSGCASITRDALENIHEGDTKEHVVEIMGQPSDFSADTYRYRSGSESCAFKFKSNKVEEFSCQGHDSRKAQHALGAFFKGASDGMKAQESPEPQTIHCSSTRYGYTTNTTCR